MPSARRRRVCSPSALQIDRSPECSRATSSPARVRRCHLGDDLVEGHRRGVDDAGAGRAMRRAGRRAPASRRRGRRATARDEVAAAQGDEIGRAGAGADEMHGHAASATAQDTPSALNFGTTISRLGAGAGERRRLGDAADAELRLHARRMRARRARRRGAAPPRRDRCSVRPSRAAAAASAGLSSDAGAWRLASAAPARARASRTDARRSPPPRRWRGSRCRWRRSWFHRAPLHDRHRRPEAVKAADRLGARKLRPGSTRRRSGAEAPTAAACDSIVTALTTSRPPRRSAAQHGSNASPRARRR